MYKYAQIENGKVHYILEHEVDIDELYNHYFSTEITLIDITNREGVIEGMVYDGINFTMPFSPSISLESLKEKKWAEIKKIRDAKEREPFPYLGKLFDFDSLSSERLTWLIDASRTAISLNIPFETAWTCYDNTIIYLSSNEVIRIPLAVAQRSDALHTKAREYRLAIDNATTPEELEGIIWLDDI